MATESEIQQSWMDCWNQCFPDCPADDNHIRLLRKQWKQFPAALVGEAMRKTAKKWKNGDLTLDDDDELEHLLARYTRGILNRTAAKSAPTPTPASVNDNKAQQQQQLAAERAAREKAEAENARLKLILAEQLKHRSITVDAFVAEQCREANEMAVTGTVTF
jgi:hypothetical protein